MTFNQFAITYLTERGLFESYAKQVLEMVKENRPDMSDLWDDNVNGFDVAVKAAVAMSLRSHAVEWIDKNLPQAFCRPMFTSEI